MAHTPPPFDLSQLRWLYDRSGKQAMIVAQTRRTITVAYRGNRYRLRRRALERTGVAIDRDVAFLVTVYGSYRP